MSDRKHRQSGVVPDDGGRNEAGSSTSRPAIAPVKSAAVSSRNCGHSVASITASAPRSRLWHRRRSYAGAKVIGQFAHGRIVSPDHRAVRRNAPKARSPENGDGVGAGLVAQPEHGDGLARSGPSRRRSWLIDHAPWARLLAMMLPISGVSSFSCSAMAERNYDVARQRAAGEGRARLDIGAGTDPGIAAQRLLDIRGVGADPFRDACKLVGEGDGKREKGVERVLHHLRGLDAHPEQVLAKVLEQRRKFVAGLFAADPDDDATGIAEDVERTTQSQIFRRTGEIDLASAGTRLERFLEPRHCSDRQLRRHQHDRAIFQNGKCRLDPLTTASTSARSSSSTGVSWQIQMMSASESLRDRS